MERTDYEKQAGDFLDKHGLELKVAFKGDQCPPWEKDDGNHVHGDRYRVTIRHKKRTYTAGTCPGRPCGTDCDHTMKGGSSISFDFWNSLHDMQEGKRPTAYDVLACISGDASLSDDLDEIINDLGPVPIKQVLNAARFGQRLRGFFTEEELEDLAEIS